MRSEANICDASFPHSVEDRRCKAGQNDVTKLTGALKCLFYRKERSRLVKLVRCVEEVSLS